MKVLVLGAGVIGTTMAWYLRAEGHAVTVVDRQPNVGLETSFANGGQVSVCHAEPWAGPGTLSKVLKWLGKADAPLLFRLRMDPAQWAWGLQFLRECTPERWQTNVRHLVALGLHSRAELKALRQQLGLRYDHGERGILSLFLDHNQAGFEQAVQGAAVMRGFGVEREVLDPAACLAVEPALFSVAERIVGGTYTSTDETGDARLFTLALAQRAEQAGVRFLFNTRVQRLEPGRGRVDQVRLLNEDGSVTDERADVIVVAMGPHSRALLAPLGVACPTYPAKGYSASFQLQDPARAPTLSVTDEVSKMVFTRLGDRLRVAGTAEINGYDLSLNWVRCHALARRTRELFPGAVDERSAQFWTGLRPSTPNNLPLLGRAPGWNNLYLNTGHGTLGWTHACGSAAVLREVINGRDPGIDYPLLGRTV